MNAEFHIGKAAKRLSVTPKHLRELEREGRIPAPKRDANGRVYTELNLALLHALGVGSRPRRLKAVDEILETL